jgi:GrpB-like predicted nucleotidyltransferase (UPF0157 family)
MPETTAGIIHVIDYDPTWPQHYQTERALLLGAAGSHILELEHVGSTAIPGLAAKPVIDMMAALPDLAHGADVITALAPRGYRLIETGMRARLLLRKQLPAQAVSFQLHLVTAASWPTRNERLLRDYLLTHPEAALAYGQLKQRLALEHPHDGAAYTRAKTELIQAIMDLARDERGLPRVDVWED